MIAIDFSMNSAGVIVGNSNNPSELQMLCFRQRKRDDSLVKNITIKEYLECPKSDEERFYYIAKTIFDFIDTHSTTKIVYIEDYSYGSTGSVFNIAEATGLLKHLLYMNGYVINKVSPKALKKHATGSGNASKGDMFNAFIDNTNYDFNSVFIGPQKAVKKGDEKIPAPFSDLIDAYFLLQYGIKNSSV